MTATRTVRLAALGAGLSLALGLGGCAGRQHVSAEQNEVAGRRLRLDLAEMYVQRGALDAAVPLLQRAIAEEPENPLVHTLYGTVLRERGLYAQAERELRQAVTLAPDHAPAWANFGILLDLQRRSAEAERAHRKAIRLSPRSAAYWNNLGFSLYVAERNDAAITALEQALALDPSLAIAHNNLGFARGRQGNYPAAEKSFRMAAGLSGGGGAGATVEAEAQVDINLALVHEQAGHADQAAQLRARALELGAKPEDLDSTKTEEVAR